MNVITFPNLGLNFNINPIFFKLGSFQIYWYAVIIILGILLGFLYASYFCRKDKEDTEALYDILLAGLPSALVGARLYYVVFNFQLYRNNLVDIFKIYEGGIAIYGAVIGAVISTFIYCKIKKRNILQFFDYGAAGLFVGQCVGRWGNFVNQEAFGGNYDGIFSMKGNVIEETLVSLRNSGVQIDPSIGVHPTFLYESFWNFIGIILLFFIFKKRKHYGTAFSFYLIWYSFGRFFIEGLRTDSLMLTSTIRISQLVAVICIIIGAVILFINSKYKKNLIVKPGEVENETEETINVEKDDKNEEKSGETDE